MTDKTTLAEYNEDTTLEELVPESKPITNKMPNSVRNTAAQVAMLNDSPEAAVEAYRTAVVNGDLGDRTDVNNVVQEANRTIKAEEKELAQEEMANPNLSLEQKESLITNNIQGESEDLPPAVLLKRKALEQDAAVSERMESIRMSMVDVLESGFDEAKEREKNAQALAMEYDTPGYLDAVRDFTELYLLPGVEIYNARRLSEDFTGETGGFLYGNVIQGMQEYIMSKPQEDRVQVANELVQLLREDSGGIMGNDENAFQAVQYLMDVVEGREIPDSERYLMNLGSALEILPFVPAFVRGGFKAAVRAIRGGTKATSSLGSIRGLNVKRERGVFTAVEADDTGEVAEALTGTTRANALADEVLPQADTGNSVDVRTVDPARESNKAELLDDESYDVADIQYMPEERAQMENWVTEKVAGSTVAKPAPNMSTIGANDAGTGVRYQATYTAPDGGFLTAQEAVDRVKFTLRDLGVEDEHITVLKNTGGKYEEVADMSGEGNFIARVDSEWEWDSDKVLSWSSAAPKVRLGSLGQVIGRQLGPLWNRMLFSPSDMMHESVFKSANAAVDASYGLAKRLHMQNKEFVKSVRKLNSEQQFALVDWFKKANDQGLEFSARALDSMGFTPDMIQAARVWRDKWDTLYQLENKDVVRTMRAQNVHVWESSDGATKLFVQPQRSTHGLGEAVKVLDPATNEVKVYTRAQMDELYEQGGQFGKLRRTMDVNGESVDYIVSPNTNKSYYRAVKESDRPLNYRQGYYKKNYGKDNHFVRIANTDKNGNVVRKANGQPTYRAVAVTGSKSDGDLILRNMMEEKGFKGDQKDFGTVTRDKIDPMHNYDDYWDIQESGGRSAQRYRGKGLNASDTPGVNTLDSAYVDGPLESLIASTKSIAKRTAMRPWIEGQKKRFMAEYGDMLPSENGQVIFPNKPTQVGDSMHDLKRTAEARQQWEYINSIENGYQASGDQFIKSIFNALADSLGAKGHRVGERVSNKLAQGPLGQPMSHARSASFRMLLALNPVRQLFVQSHQAVQIGLLNPVYATRHLVGDTTGMIAARTGNFGVAAKLMGVTESEARKIYKAFEKTGIPASISQQSLINGAVTSAIDNSKALGGAKGKAAAVIDAPKVGFTEGEWINQTTGYMFARYRAIQNAKADGIKNFDPDTPVNAAQIAADARNITYNMSAAGEMPYNHGTLGTVMQFMQVPHKAVLGMITNRGLEKHEKIQLLVGNTLLYGIPTAMIEDGVAEYLSNMSQEVRDTVVFGLEAAALNAVLNGIYDTGTDTRVNLNNVAPGNLNALYDIFHNFANEGIMEVIANSPSGSLFMNNGRLTHFMKTALSYVGVSESVPVEDAKQVLVSLGKTSSGFSSWWKYHMYDETGKMVSASGKSVPFTPTEQEAFFAMLGLTTHDEAAYWNTSMEQYSRSKQMKDDVKLTVDTYMKALSDQGETFDYTHSVKMFNFIKQRFEGIPGADDEIRSQMTKGDRMQTIVQKSITSAGIIGWDQVFALITKHGGTQEQIDEIKTMRDLAARTEAEWDRIAKEPDNG